MKLIRRDEQKRLSIPPDDVSGIFLPCTDGYSYKGARDMYKSMGDVMGLDQEKMYITRREAEQ